MPVYVRLHICSMKFAKWYNSPKISDSAYQKSSRSNFVSKKRLSRFFLFGLKCWKILLSYLAFSRFPFVKVTAVCGFNQTYLYSRREKKSKRKRKSKCKSAQKWKVCLRRVKTGKRLLKRRKAACQWFMNCSYYNQKRNWVGLFHWQLALR